MMKSLFLLIALYTISGKQAVPSGVVPEGSTCVYEQTSNKSGQLTAGSSLTLTLNGYDGAQLQSMTLHMRSNTSSGAGSMQLTVDGAPVWSISDAAFSSTTWAGAFSTEWEDISEQLDDLMVPPEAPIVLHIQASQNSLYLQSVEIEYTSLQEEQPIETYTVSFDTHISQQLPALMQDEPGSAIVLPEVELEDDKWQFIGWALTPIDECEERPSVYQAGTLFGPSADCTLHAVYAQKGEEQTWYPTDDLTKDDYMIALYEPTANMIWVAMGPVQNGVIATETATVDANNGWIAMPQVVYGDYSVYTLSVTGETLSITHKHSGKPVKLGSGGKFSDSAAGNPWQITPSESDSPMPYYDVYGVSGTKRYYFSFKLGTNGLISFSPSADAGQLHKLLFFAVDDRLAAPAKYSSYPFGNAVTILPADAAAAYHVQMGAYIMTIINGKKYLQINE